jgi:YD repeat-containing protein
MTGYIVTYDGIYKSLKLVPGKTYEYEGDYQKGDIYSIQLLPDDLIYLQSYKSESTIIFEVEILNSVRTYESYVLADKMKIIRIIPKEEYNSLFSNFVFDENNNLIEDKLGEITYEYNDKNLILCTKKSGEIESTYEYDENNKLIHYKNDTYEEWYEYDNNGNMVHFKDSIISEMFCTYDAKNRLINVKGTENNFEVWFTYDERDNLILEKDKLGNEKYAQYDKNNNIINFKTNNNYEFIRKYDEDNNLISHQDNMYLGSYKNKIYERSLLQN